MHAARAGIIFSLILVPVFTGTPSLLPPYFKIGSTIGKKIRSKTIPALAALNGVINLTIL